MGRARGARCSVRTLRVEPSRRDAQGSAVRRNVTRTSGGSAMHHHVECGDVPGSACASSRSPGDVRRERGNCRLGPTTFGRSDVDPGRSRDDIRRARRASSRSLWRRWAGVPAHLVHRRCSAGVPAHRVVHRRPSARAPCIDTWRRRRSWQRNVHQKLTSVRSTPVRRVHATLGVRPPPRGTPEHGFSRSHGPLNIATVAANG